VPRDRHRWYSAAFSSGPQRPRAPRRWASAWPVAPA
jgi:hypothetical protein